MTVVKFCPCNFEEELEAVKDSLAVLPNIEVTEERCLLYCGQCLVEPFAVVDGENVSGESADHLLLAVKKKLHI